MSKAKRRVLVVVMDGVGARSSNYGNAVKLAYTPYMNFLEKKGLFRTLKAHGTYVGLPSDADIGNSEVGHNAMGAGRVFDQGAKLVQKAIDTGRLFEGQTWRELVNNATARKSTLHFLGLLSDGNVHSHEQHLYAMLRRARREGVQRVRVHVLFDGRDVGEKTAEIYASRLQAVMDELRSPDFDIQVASGGGRMSITMDRYEADWPMVQRGWEAHVLGEAPHTFSSLSEALSSFRALDNKLTDQYLPAFVITAQGKPVGAIHDGDSVVLFNFRGDRAIEISRAFSEVSFAMFPRRRFPDVKFAGMMEYDGDLHIPPRYLVTPPQIDKTLTEYLVQLGVRQFACSETQKFGHVTYFWNGNRSSKFDEALEEYIEIPSDNIQFDLKPWMKAAEITQCTIDHMRAKNFHFGRINFPNGDMVGHTGNLSASIVAISTVDLCLGRLIEAARETDTLLIVTADHGNADEMFDTNKEGPANWLELPPDQWPKPRTAHTVSEVPFYFYDPRGPGSFKLATVEGGSIAHLAATVLSAMGLPSCPEYLPSLVEPL